jgi:hypothetical protein
MPRVDAFLNRRYTQMDADVRRAFVRATRPDKSIDALKGIPLVAVAFSAQFLHAGFYS